jgi:DNA-directed RNA polymerase specialized sigma subunit
MTFITSAEWIDNKIGKLETEKKIVLSMFEKSLPMKDIPEIIELSIEQVREIHSQ